MDYIDAAYKTLAPHKEFLVGYSGGKDSKACLELVCQSNPTKVVCFFMYMVPGLTCIEEMLEEPKKRYGVQVLQFPHWVLSKTIAFDTFRLPTPDKDLPQWDLDQNYRWARKATGIRTIVHGAKKSDSQWRRRSLAAGHNSENVVYPIVEWSKLQVLAYLRMRNIPIPDSSGHSATGIDLSTPSVLWLHDHYPEDYKKLLEYFPLAQAIVSRRTFYGENMHRSVKA